MTCEAVAVCGTAATCEACAIGDAVATGEAAAGDAFDAGVAEMGVAAIGVVAVVIVEAGIVSGDVLDVQFAGEALAEPPQQVEAPTAVSLRVANDLAGAGEPAVTTAATEAEVGAVATIFAGSVAAAGLISAITGFVSAFAGCEDVIVAVAEPVFELPAT